jgi:ribosomal protein S18 acetylase RimI-like enzyme
MNQKREIRIITNEPLEPSVALIRRSFATVAAEMGFTEQNAPRYTAFITKDNLEETRKWGGIFWGLFIGGRQVGFVAVVKEKDGKYSMKRLAVLPEYRHGGSGRALVDTVINYVRSLGEKKLYIGMVNEETVLKNWYLAMGFKVTSILNDIPDLPFTVALMELDI